MDFIPEKIADYVAKYSENEPELLQQLNKETWQKILAPRMLSGHFQGRLLALLSKIISPKNILEIGTYTGYATLCLAEGIQKEGTIHTIDCNEELQEIQQKYFKKSNFSKQIKAHVGNALAVIANLNTTFDLVFIDADKENYSNYFHAILPKMNKGGIILSDNVLWSGKVVEKANPKDIDTIALQEYNQLLKEDPRVETIVLPIRDGLSVSRII